MSTLSKPNSLAQSKGILGMCLDVSPSPLRDVSSVRPTLLTQVTLKGFGRTITSPSEL